MDQRGLLVWGVAFALIGAAMFVAGWMARRRLTSLGVWNVTLIGNGILVGGMARLTSAGVLPGGAGVARWLDGGAFTLFTAGFLCFLLQVARDSQSAEAWGSVSAAGTVQNAAPTAAVTPAAAPPQTVAPMATAQAPAETAVQTVGQGRN